MSSTVLASRYLKAYSNCFVKQERIDALEDLKVFTNEVVSKDSYYKMLVSPTINYIEKAEKLSVMPFLKVRPFLKNLILLLNSKSRLALLKEINDIIDSFILGESNQVNVKIHSAVELTSSQLDNISNFIKKKLNKTPKVEVVIDESILGGFKIVSGNTVYDGTVTNTLNKLKLSFN